MLKWLACPSNVVLGLLFCLTALSLPQTASQEGSRPPRVPARPTEGDVLRGSYGPYRANNDLLFYHLDVRVDPEKKHISGKNTIRFKMLSDGTRIQLELNPAFTIEKIVFDPSSRKPITLHYQRAADRTLYVDFPQTLKSGGTYTIDFYYSGNPVDTGRFGGFSFKKDPAGRTWITTACEGEGASIWWPNKDQWRDEVENMQISVSIPNDLVDASNGRLMGKTDLGDGYTRWDWSVSYPINNYDVSLNIAKYVQFRDKYEDLPLDYYVLPEDREKAKKQFVQAKKMQEAFEHYFGEYPFQRDGYKLVQVPYTGMEHQSAVTYGNGFENGYVGHRNSEIGLRFDFIIIHESAHEWFGNAITAKDRSDMWIHEGWANYLETLYVEYFYGKDDAIKYLNEGKDRVRNTEPIISPHNVFSTPPADQYKKGALFLNTVRSVINDDARWWSLLRGYFQRFKYQTIMTEDMLAFFNTQTGMDLTVIFNQYLRHASVPVLDLKFDDAMHTVAYRWQADEPKFAMPIRVGTRGQWQTIHPTTEWQSMPNLVGRDRFDVASDFYYVNVVKS